MESARELLAGVPPDLLFLGGTTHFSVSEARVSARFLKSWPRFEQHVLEVLRCLDLSHSVPIIPEQEHYLVGNETGMSSRFVRNVCDPVSSALSTTHIGPVFFGDVQIADAGAPIRPDLCAFRKTNHPQPLERHALNTIAAGELKAEWTANLGSFPITDPLPHLRHLERPVDGTQASTRHADARVFVAQPGTLQYSISNGTIFLGDGNSNTVTAATFTRFISGNSRSSKAIMAVEWGGAQCVAKCWGPELGSSYSSEVFVYQELANRNPEGYDFFARPLACGKVTCSSVWPTGYILILSHVQGKPLLDLLPQLHVAEVDHVKRRCRSAVEIFREIGIWIGDCGVHNVLYNRQSCKVTLLDFEVIGDCDMNHKRYLEGPEMIAIFGRDASRTRATGE